jgi:hypothetical protein
MIPQSDGTVTTKPNPPWNGTSYVNLSMPSFTAESPFDLRRNPRGDGHTWVDEVSDLDNGLYSRKSWEYDESGRPVWPCFL